MTTDNHTPTSSTPPDPTAAAHVLVVDDVEANRVLTQSMLERLGHRVTTANDGVQALDRLASTRFDAVLMDWHMPELDGLGAAVEYYRRCREFGLEPAPVVMITAHVTDTARQQCADAGLADFLAKPISVESLRSCLEQWIESHPTDPSLPAETTTTADSGAAPDDTPVAAGPVEDAVLLDREVIDTLVEDLGGPETVVAIIDAFLSEADERRAAIQPATRTTTAEAHRACHTLKSTAAILGATRLSTIAKTYEVRLREGDVPSDTQLADFDVLVQATIDALIARRDELLPAR